MPLDADLFAEIFKDPCNELLGACGLRPGADDGKLVAAHARHKCIMRRIGQAFRHRAQHRIPNRGFEQIVDLLEMIEPDIHDSKWLSSAPSAVHSRPQIELKCVPVRKLGQRIVVRQISDPRLRFDPVGDILRQNQDVLLRALTPERPPYGLIQVRTIRMFEGKLSGDRFRSTLGKRHGIVLADHLGDIWRKDLLGGMAELLIERDVKKLGRDLVDQHILAIGRPFDCQPDRKIVDDRPQKFARFA